MPNPEHIVKVISVTDGDTVIVRDLDSHRNHTVRLHAIDAPERDQPYGRESSDFVFRTARRKTSTMEVITYPDRYDRIVGILYERDRSESLNHQIVAAGLAYDYPTYGTIEGIKEAEVEARRNSLGVWQRPGGGVRPWKYRHIPKPVGARRRTTLRQLPTPAQPSRQPKPEQKRVFQRPPSGGPGCLVALFALVIFLVNRK